MLSKYWSSCREISLISLSLNAEKTEHANKLLAEHATAGASVHNITQHIHHMYTSVLQNSKQKLRKTMCFVP